MSKRFVNIAVPPLEQLFTYMVKSDEDLIGLGLNIPFGRTTRFGYIVEEIHQVADESKLKSLNLNQELYRCFLPFQLEFFRWIASYYGASLAQTIDTAVPKPIPQKLERFISFLQDPEKPLTGPLQKTLFEVIKASTIPLAYSELLIAHKGALSPLRALEKKGLIKIEFKPINSSLNLQVPNWAKRDVNLNEDQQHALSVLSTALKEKKFSPFLLHGVTGSGKTEVYIEAINIAKKLGLGALIIVPEIALTPQLIDRFTARLGTDIAILHSAISNRERWESWSTLLNGKTDIAIGARSGVFAPIKNLGLIIVDEEHDGSYKQAEGLKYNARDLAIVLASRLHCPVVLGSATPSLETYNNALTKRYGYLPLKRRHDSGSSIDIKIVDMNKAKEAPSANLSKELYQALEETLARHEQAFILYNRRGFACYMQCDTCHTVMTCPNCSVTLTLHATDQTLKCHYCDYKIAVPQSCPNCTGEEQGRLNLRGSGTEKVFDEIMEFFPKAKIARLDRDAADNPLQYRTILDEMRAGKTDILVGTQMIAKGHDLPGVTLVGIVDCDVGLHIPDFRASERVFQLLTQASGRAGRAALQGHVILQTRVPNHLSLIGTKNKSFGAFAKIELANRRDLLYPPFSRLLRVLVSSEDTQEALDYITKIKQLSLLLIKNENLKVSILGPCPTTIAKIRNRWRWHLIFKADLPSTLNTVMKALQAKTKKIKPSLRISYDIDPQDLL